MIPALRSLALALVLFPSSLACESGGGETATVGGASTAGGTTSGTTTETLPGTTAVTEGSGTTAVPGSSSALDPDGSSSGGAEPPVVFDFPGLPDAPSLEASCGMVDFLFVIDDSGSMSDEQMALVANFAAFIAGIEATLETVDSIHVGVTTTDEYAHNLPGCQQLGALVVQTATGACGPYEEGGNYMTELDDLDEAFGCAALVGTQGDSFERPMQAMVDAVTGVNADEGECNEGFMRPDALLVVVIITDESDVTSPGSPMSWYQAVVDAKLGIPENVVVVSLINVPGSGCNGFDPAQGIADFTTMFGINGFLAEICLPDFAPIFAQAVDIIADACDNYVPPS